MKTTRSFPPNKTCSCLALLAALGSAACSIACGNDDGGGRELVNVGTLTAPLMGTSALGFQFRLRNAVLSVEGPTPTTVDSENYLDQPSLDLTLSAGAYTISLAEGWALEREQDGAFVPVRATLASDALQPFTIVANQRSTVLFKFQAGDDVLEVGEGGLGFVLEVEDAPDAPEPPAAADAEATQAACTDNVDNDGDGLTDCDDPGCVMTKYCAPWQDVWTRNQWVTTPYGICGIRADHLVACSGSYAPLAGMMLDEIASGVGNRETCGLTYPEHELVCTGSIAGAQYQTGEFKSVTTGLETACGTRPSGELVCWGSNSPEQPGNPLVGGPRADDVPAVGGRHGCYLARGKPQCWGENSLGQLNAPNQYLSDLVAGFEHTCGLSEGQTAICWGSGSEGQLRAPSAAFFQLSAGFYHTCGIKDPGWSTNGAIACWGNDQDGRSSPPSGDDFTQIHLADDYGCAQRSDGSFACWGSTPFGQEVSDDFLTVPVPKHVSALQAGPWTAIVPLSLNRDRYQDLLYYDAATGRAVYTAGTGTPGVEDVVLETSYAPGWTDVVPAWHTEESTLTDLSFYDSVSGNYSATIATSVPGVQTELYSGTGTPGCTSVVPMTMDADGLTDALWYDASTGKGIFSASQGARSEVLLGKGWTTVLPVHLNSDPDTDLLFYNRITGKVSLSVSTGPAVQQHLADGNFRPGWTALVPIDLNGDHFTDVMRYDASSGKTVYTTIFAEGELRDVRATQEAPGQTLFAPMRDYQDHSHNFLTTYRHR